jgi:uncharacterized small protein (DUF1192 family)
MHSRRINPGAGFRWKNALSLSHRTGGAAMFDEDLTPKKKLAHEIGQDLTLLSVEELAERIALLRQEIARLDEAMAKKRASLAAADQFFKR